MNELSILLETFSIILAESGTTTLVAALVSCHHKVISLCPKRLLHEPDDAMLLSGLPYILMFPHKVYFILGESVEQSLIQSSDVCKYNIQEIDHLINHVIQ